MTATEADPAQGHRIDLLPLDDLLDMRHPRNPKDHDLDQIEAAFERFGFTVPVLLDDRTDILAAGHGRLAALERRYREGRPAPTGILVAELEGQPGALWMVPTVRGWRSADDDELLAYVVTDNHLTGLGGWTDELAPILAELQAKPMGLPPGFSTDDVETMLAELGADVLPEGETDAAYADDLSGRGEPAAPRTQQGLHEVGLMFQTTHHAEYVRLLGELRHAWGADLASPMIVLRALRQARDAL
jgi:hypothetical protein